MSLRPAVDTASGGEVTGAGPKWTSRRLWRRQRAQGTRCDPAAALDWRIEPYDCHLRMTASAADHASPGPGFFASLPLLAAALDTFDPGRYRRAPDDWELAVTDIVDSTGAIAKGRHKT